MKRLTTNQVKLGFIGLGNMGSRIANRLLNHGYQLSVYDMDPAKTQVIAAQGAAVRFADEVDENEVIKHAAGGVEADPVQYVDHRSDVDL